MDFLRFLPEKTDENRVRWWTAVLVAGPGWVVPGMLKMLAGAFLAFLALQHEVPADKAIEPTQMYLAGFSEVFSSPFWSPQWALGVTVLFVIISQVKINVTDAYAGSLAWSIASISSSVYMRGLRKGSAQSRRRATTCAPQPRSSPMSRTRLRT